MKSEMRPPSAAGTEAGNTQVLLVNLPPWLPYAPPVGLASIAGVAKNAGFRTGLLDINVQLYHDRPDLQKLWTMERHSAWLGESFDRDVLPLLQGRLERAIDEIVDCEAGLVGLAVAAPRKRIVQWFCGRLRQRKFAGLIVLGGPTTFTDGERRALLDEFVGLADAVVIGEGESTFLALLNAWRENLDLLSVAGVAVPDGKNWRIGEPRPHLNMDSLPIPDYSVFDLGRYTDRTLCVEWSRGCIRRCKFCEVSSMWGARRSKSPDRIIAEMTTLAKRFGIFHFSLADSAANGHPRRFEELLDLLIDLDEKFTWSANMIAHRGFDRTLARKMRQAGCIRAEIGVESGSSRVLHLMHKGARVADNERTLDALKNAGVESVVFLLVGFPGETEEDFAATLNFLEKNRTNIDLVRSANALALHEGADVFEEVERTGFVPPRSTPLWHLRWTAGPDNTPDVRRERVGRVKVLLDRLGILHELASGEDEFETTRDFAINR